MIEFIDRTKLTSQQLEWLEKLERLIPKVFVDFPSCIHDDFVYEVFKARPVTLNYLAKECFQNLAYGNYQNQGLMWHKLFLKIDPRFYYTERPTVSESFQDAFEALSLDRQHDFVIGLIDCFGNFKLREYYERISKMNLQYPPRNACNEFYDWRTTASRADLAAACALTSELLAEIATDGVTRSYWETAATRFAEVAQAADARVRAGVEQYIRSLTSHALKVLVQDLANQAGLGELI